MKRLTVYEIHAIISHAEALQVARRGLLITIDVLPVSYYGIGLGFTVARRQGNDRPPANIRVISSDTLEDKGFTTVQSVIDFMTDTANEVMI